MTFSKFAHYLFNIFWAVDSDEYIKLILGWFARLTEFGSLGAVSKSSSNPVGSIPSLLFSVYLLTVTPSCRN